MRWWGKEAVEYSLEKVSSHVSLGLSLSPSSPSLPLFLRCNILYRQVRLNPAFPFFLSLSLFSYTCRYHLYVYHYCNVHFAPSSPCIYVCVPVCCVHAPRMTSRVIVLSLAAQVQAEVALAVIRGSVIPLREMRLSSSVCDGLLNRRCNDGSLRVARALVDRMMRIQRWFESVWLAVKIRLRSTLINPLPRSPPRARTCQPACRILGPRRPGTRTRVVHRPCLQFERLLISLTARDAN